jgi:hypothetical protein
MLAVICTVTIMLGAWNAAEIHIFSQHGLCDLCVHEVFTM